MKTKLLAIGLFFASFVSKTHAEGTSATVRVDAKMIEPLNLTVVNMQLGTFSAKGAGKFEIAPKPGASATTRSSNIDLSPSGTPASPGKVTVIGERGYSYTFNFDTSVTMDGRSGQAAKDSDKLGLKVAARIKGKRRNLNDGGTINPRSKKTEIYIGGTVTVDANDSKGNYRGTINVSVAYN